MTDKNITKVENHPNEEEKWVYSGYMLKNKLYGPGSKLNHD